MKVLVLSTEEYNALQKALPPASKAEERLTGVEAYFYRRVLAKVFKKPVAESKDTARKQ